MSIAKAGITTTLNARTAVLAAANPVMIYFRGSSSESCNLILDWEVGLGGEDSVSMACLCWQVYGRWQKKISPEKNLGIETVF